jgi:hypothetical protein
VFCLYWLRSVLRALLLKKYLLLQRHQRRRRQLLRKLQYLRPLDFRDSALEWGTAELFAYLFFWVQSTVQLI